MGRMLRMVRIFMAVYVMAMPAFGGGRDVHDLYGAPAMYGEPERDMPTRDTLLKMYGTPPAARARPISAPIVTSPGGDRRPARPPRAAPKQAAKKKTSNAQKPQVKKPALVKKQVPASGAATPAKTAPSHAVVAAPDVRRPASMALLLLRLMRRRPRHRYAWRAPAFLSGRSMHAVLRVMFAMAWMLTHFVKKSGRARVGHCRMD